MARYRYQPIFSELILLGALLMIGFGMVLDGDTRFDLEGKTYGRPLKQVAQGLRLVVSIALGPPPISWESAPTLISASCTMASAAMKLRVCMQAGGGADEAGWRSRGKPFCRAGKCPSPSQYFHELSKAFLLMLRNGRTEILPISHFNEARSAAAVRAVIEALPRMDKT